MTNRFAGMSLVELVRAYDGTPGCELEILAILPVDAPAMWLRLTEEERRLVKKICAGRSHIARQLPRAA